MAKSKSIASASVDALAEIKAKLESLTPEQQAELLLAELEASVSAQTELSEKVAVLEEAETELSEKVAVLEESETALTEKVKTLEGEIAGLMENVASSKEVVKENHVKVGSTVYKLITPSFYMKVEGAQVLMNAEKLNSDKKLAQMAIEAGNLVALKGE
jgi:predicted nuclease with TOPRIM domain